MPDPAACPLLGVKRTSLIRALMSANDPKRTSTHWICVKSVSHEPVPGVVPRADFRYRVCEAMTVERLC